MGLVSNTIQPTVGGYTPSGDTINFSDLEITFLVDENLENFRDTWLDVWYWISKIKNTIRRFSWCK